MIIITAPISQIASKLVGEFPIPPSINLQMGKGFTLYMMRAVWNGRGDELIDLARTNLWH